MNLISRIKIGYKKSGLMIKIGYWFAFIGVILSIIFFIYQNIESKNSEMNVVAESKISEKNITQILFTQKLSEWNVSKCSDVVVGLGDKFPELICAVPIKKELCKSSLTNENGSLLINDCDIAYKKISLPDSDTGFQIDFKPLWSVEDTSIHYLFDIFKGDDSERNRISLYTQGGYLKYSITNINGTEEQTIKIKLKNNLAWNENDFNKIDIGWYKDTGRMFLSLNGNKSEKAVGNINIDLSDIFLFLGVSIFGDSQANGYFDNFRIFDPSIIFDSVTIFVPDAGTGDAWQKILIHGTNKSGTWFKAYWNYSKDNSAYSLVDLGNITPDVVLILPEPSQVRFGSIIFEFHLNEFSTPWLYNIMMYTRKGKGFCAGKC